MLAVVTDGGDLGMIEDVFLPVALRKAEVREDLSPVGLELLDTAQSGANHAEVRLSDIVVGANEAHKHLVVLDVEAETLDGSTEVSKAVDFMLAVVADGVGCGL